jgi:DNA-binding transcriptional LysR family regulator
MDFSIIRLFVAAAETGTIAKAAQSCGLSPSYASRKLAELEKTLDCRLITRTTRNHMLTEAGRAYLCWAREALRHRADLIENLSTLKEQPAGLIKIACKIYAGHGHLRHAIQLFKASNPDVRFEINVCDDPIAMLARGYDLALDAGPMTPRKFVGCELYSYRRKICASPTYLSMHDCTMRAPRDLDHHVCLYNSLDDSGIWHFVSSEGALIHYRVDPYLRVNSYVFLRELALEGIGVICISERIIKDDLAAGRLVELLPAYKCVDAAGRDFVFRVAYPDQRLPKRVRLLVDFLSTQFRTERPTGLANAALSVGSLVRASSSHRLATAAKQMP